MKRLALGLAFAFCAHGAQARAQEGAVHLVWHAEGGASERGAGRVERRLAAEGLDVRVDDAWASARGVDQTEAHAALVRVESALSSARTAMRAFDEHAALTILGGARTDATRALALSGAVAWAAEVELAIGRIAAQSGQIELARASFARAFGLAPARALGAAEAAPDVVALADEVRAAVRAQPASRFDVAVTWDEPALVFLDDQPIGRAPRRIETRAGAHVLRIEADGAEPYVAWIDVLPGTRPPLSVMLSPTVLVGAVRAAHEVVSSDDLDALPARVRAITSASREPVVIWVVEAVSGPIERAIVTPCDAERCHVPARIDPGSLASPIAALSSEAVSSVTRSLAIAWRDEPIPLEPPLPPPTDPWSEPWPWALVATGAAIVIAGIVVGVIFATLPPPDHELHVEVHVVGQ